MKTSKLLLAVLLFGVVQGCQCNRPTSTRARGEVRFVITQLDDTKVQSENALYDFGTVSMGKTVTKTMVIENVGLGSLQVQRFSKQSGGPAKVGSYVDDASPIFTIDFAQETIVPAGQSVQFTISYAPPVVEGVMQVAHETVLVMSSADTDEGKGEATVTLKGLAVTGECALPDVIDFGGVVRGETASVELAFTNQQPIDTRGYVGPVESQQGAGLFGLSPDSPSGEFVIGSQRTKTVTVTFRPTEPLEYSGLVTMRRADGCPEKRVRVRGTGVGAVLSWAPPTLNFGYVLPGSTVTQEVIFYNLAKDPVALNMVGTKEGTVSSVAFQVTEAGSDLSSLTVPPSSRSMDSLVPGQATIKVSFAPTVLGVRNAQLTAVTSLSSQPMISIGLKGVGGGPDIDARPAALNFQRIAYFAGASPASFALRKITVQNVGTRPTPLDPQANLKLGQLSGTDYGRPYWEIVPKNGASIDEICVGTFDSMTGLCSNDLPTAGAGRYDPAFGLEAGGTNSVVEIPVRVTPNGLGLREFEVKLFSNDPDEPVTTVTVSANAVELPPCDIEVSPIALAFGIVAPPTTKDLAFTIRNRRTGPNDICLISNLQLLPEAGTPAGMSAIFSLPGGPIDELELLPGETKQVTVRAWPQGLVPPLPATVVGKLVFNVADPVNPLREVALTATVTTSCLTISPSSLDFGTVQKECNSPTRTFQIYNTCSSKVVVNSTSMVSAAGEGPMGPNCPGTSPCPEFHMVTGVSGPVDIPPGSSAPVTFSLKYRPINYGPDTGAFVVNATQFSQVVDYVVTLQGKGDMGGLNTDTFRQDSKPKADILLVIDDSCSMGDKQQALADNMAAFLQYATSNQVDFQLGVVTTNTDLPVGTLGALRQVSGRKVLRDDTPNLASEFANLVKVGISGSGTESCMEPATAALTAPLISDPSRNAGFLRPDAVLAVVCISDAGDQATNGPAFYLNQLLNIKGAQRSSLFTYNVVGPTLPSAPVGCEYDMTAGNGRHEFMVAQTNGVLEEICTPNWAAALERVGKSAFGYRSNFYLTARPDLSAMTPISVSIDGTSLPEIDPNRGARIWQYDSAANSINFDPFYLPEPGKTLTVTYVAVCIL